MSNRKIAGLAVVLCSAAAGQTFEFKGAAEPPGRVSWRVPGIPRVYFSEALPALFERTLAVEEFTGDDSRLEWIFTGPLGGFTVEVGQSRVRVYQRYYDSFGLRKAPPAQGRRPDARAGGTRRRQRRSRSAASTWAATESGSCAVRPPSTISAWPVTKEESSLARKRAAVAASRMVPGRPSG